MSYSPSFQPLGRIPPSPGGRPTFRLAVVAFVALHAVFFAGLLLQGCRPKSDDVQAAATPTNQWPEVSELFNQAWTNPPATPEDTETDLSPPPATNELLALDQPETTEPDTPPQPPDQGMAGDTRDGGQTAGQRLMGQGVGGAEEPGDSRPPVGLTTEATETLAQSREHKIQSGDTVWGLAQKYGVTTGEILAANPGVDTDRLQVDHTLVIPPAKPRPAPLEETYEGRIHVVKRGDTLIAIARQYGVSVADLRQLNNLRTDLIKVDQKLKIPPASGN